MNNKNHAHNYRAPWRKGAALSCTVFDAEGGVVASIFARTQAEQARRLHLVKMAPAMRDTLQEAADAIKTATVGADLLARIEAILHEAEPV